MKAILPLAALLATATTTAAQAPDTSCDECPLTVLRVDASSTASMPDGLDWSTAYRSLHDALQAANPGDCIWVATGRYRPGGECLTTNCSPNASYVIDKTISLFGGFAGNELCFANRAGLFKQTIITGDLTACGCPANTKVLFRVGSSPLPMGSPPPRVVLDGFLMEEAVNASNGGAIECTLADLTVRNCTIRNNQARLGAGIYADMSTLHVADSSFRQNLASVPEQGGKGGAIYARSSFVDIESSLFRENFARIEGGALWHQSGKLTVYNSTFRGNSTQNRGGVLYINDTYPWYRAQFVNCLAFGNSAAMGGVGFIDNKLPNLLYPYFGRAKFTNCTLADNTASVQGPAFHIVDTACCVSQVTVFNSILWQNTGATPEIFNPYGGATVNKSIVTDDKSGGTVANPMFKNPLSLGGTNYHLLSGSPAINLGLNSYIRPDVFDFDQDGDTAENVPWDLDQRRRIDASSGLVDAGAYEF